jgi:hypothetical protein
VEIVVLDEATDLSGRQMQLRREHLSQSADVLLQVGLLLRLLRLRDRVDFGAQRAGKEVFVGLLAGGGHEERGGVFVEAGLLRMCLRLHFLDFAGVLVVVAGQTEHLEVGSLLETRAVLAHLQQMGSGVAFDYLGNDQSAGFFGVAQERVLGGGVEVRPGPHCIFRGEGDLAGGHVGLFGEGARNGLFHRPFQ